MKRDSLVLGLAIGMTLVAPAACKVAPKPPKLDGVLSDIPVYAPSTVTKRLVYPYRGPGCPLESLIFDLETPDKWARVQAFYRQKLSFANAESATGADLSKLVFEFLPDGGNAAKNEQVTVTIPSASGPTGTRFQIKETVCASRRQGGAG